MKTMRPNHDEKGFAGTLQRLMRKHVLLLEDVAELFEQLLLAAAEEEASAGNEKEAQEHVDMERRINARLRDLEGLV